MEEHPTIRVNIGPTNFILSFCSPGVPNHFISYDWGSTCHFRGHMGKKSRSDKVTGSMQIIHIFKYYPYPEAREGVHCR